MILLPLEVVCVSSVELFRRTTSNDMSVFRPISSALERSEIILEVENINVYGREPS